MDIANKEPLYLCVIIAAKHKQSMKKSIILIIILFTFLINFQRVFAQDAASSSAIVNQEVNYFLPYPGILPDNPLYFLKALRDRAVSMMISDPLKKVEFNLLMADIRLNAAQYLFAKGENKYTLAETTISKGENYFYNALVMIDVAKRQGMPINNIVSNLKTASLKHQQVIKELKNKSTGMISSRLAEDERRAKDFEIRVSQINTN